MDDVMCKCASCGHEAMCAVGSACSECGGEMRAKEEGGAMGGEEAGAGDSAGSDDAMGGDEKPMDGMQQ